MKKGIGAFFGFILVIAIFIGLSCVVVTGEDEYKLIRQFGKIDHVESEAGLSFKVPFIQTVDTLPKKILIKLPIGSFFLYYFCHLKIFLISKFDILFM